MTGVVELIWVQLTVHHDVYEYGDTILARPVYLWLQVGGATALIAQGLLVVIAARIMGLMQAARARSSE